MYLVPSRVDVIGMGLRPGRAQMIFHAPITSEVVAGMDVDTLRDMTRGVIAGALER
ncbi:MAG: hypothetical protein V7709_13680 [Halioglobus sp.]